MLGGRSRQLLDFFRRTTFHPQRLIFRNQRTHLKAIGRVLKPDGHLTLQTAFLYPIHDSPRDYQRWTIHGLLRLTSNHGLLVERETALLAPLENAALLTNLEIAKSVLDLVRRNLLWSTITILAGPAIVLINMAGWPASWGTGDDAFMAQGYRVTWKRSVA